MKKSIYLLLGTLLFGSCSMNVEYEDRASDPNAIVDVATGRGALSTAYASYADWKNMIPLEAMSDEVMPSPLLSKNNELNALYKWNPMQMVGLADKVWRSDYATIMYVNTMIERVEKIVPKDEAEKEKLNVLLAEGKSLKALCMLNLFRLYSPRNSAEIENTNMGILDKNKVALQYPARQTMKASIEEINALVLPMIQQKSTSFDAYHLNPLAAKCIQQELAMWTGNNEKAEQLAEEMLKEFNPNLLSLASYEKLWQQSSGISPEVIFAMNIGSLREGYFFDDWRGDDGDYFVINDNITYADGDIRKPFSIVSYNFPYDHSSAHRMTSLLGKYNAIRKDNKSIQYITIFRWSDVIFNGAEAAARLGHTEKALKWVNMLLQARHATLLADNLKGDILVQSILNEKEKEFVGEGKRFFDLKRCGDIDVTRSVLFGDLRGETVMHSDFKWTWPIPPSEARYNKNPEQLPQWQPFVAKAQE